MGFGSRGQPRGASSYVPHVDRCARASEAPRGRVPLVRMGAARAARRRRDLPVYTPVGYVSGTSPASHSLVRSSGSSAIVSSRWITASNCSAILA
jgi:hypothetical protein